MNLKNLENKIKLKFIELGCQKQVAQDVAIGLVRATARGVQSHGVNLLLHYKNSVINLRKNPNPSYKLIKKKGTIIFDADHTFGIAACSEAIRRSIKFCKQDGIIALAIKNSSHCASLASFSSIATDNNLICISFTHADSLMKSPDSNSIIFGTNPICIAFPGLKKNEPIILDMASTIISWNKLKNIDKANQKLPDGVAFDKNGKLTKNPKKAISLAPIGGYKGYALACMIDLFCGLLTQMPFGKNISSMYKTSIKEKRFLGQFIILIDPSNFINRSLYNKNLKLFLNMIHSNVENRYPGEIENNSLNQMLKKGLKLNINEKKIVNDFLK